MKKQTLGYVLNSITLRYSNRTAFVFDDYAISYDKLQKNSILLAYNLLKKGIKKDDKVAIIMTNRIEYIYVYFALFLIGAWVVPINTRYELNELKNVLKDSDASTIIYEDTIDNLKYREIIDNLLLDLPLLKNQILLSNYKMKIDNNFNSLLEVDKGTQYEKIYEIVMKQERNIHPSDVALLGYTSGTTGNPKGVMIPHRNFVLMSLHIQDIWNIVDENSFVVAPLYAAQGFISLLLQLISGITIYWNRSFVPNNIAEYIKNKKLTGFHTQPTVWNLLLGLPYLKYLDLSHLKKLIVSGTICPYFLGKEIEKITNGTLLNAYGLIEATGIATITRLEDTENIRLNTVGRPIPGIELKIVNEKRQKVKKGEIGEIALKGYLMKGYYKKDEETRKVIDKDGWLYTGDLGRFFDDNNISIVGRNKDMVIRGAFNVYPIDIEECLLKFNKIEAIAVVGKPHEILGESLVAFIIPKSNTTLTKGEIIEFCRGKISNYKIPDEVIFVSQLPMLLSGKIQKNILRDWAIYGVPDESRILYENQFTL